MRKKIILTIIALILVFGGFIYLSAAGFSSLNPLAALAGLFSSPGEKETETETVRLLSEAKIELAKLQEEIDLKKEKLEEEEEMRVGLEAKYRSEITVLSGEVEVLRQMVDDFNRQMVQLANIPDSGPEFAEKSCFININIASKEDLQRLVGIGPALAQRIIEARPFSSVYDLINVSGIGEKILQKIIEQGCAYVDEVDKEIEEDEESEDEESEEEPVVTADICPVNINTASKEDLQAITGIGPALAQRIIEARPFYLLSDLIRVSGIGQTTLDKIIAQGCAYVSGYTGGGSSAASPTPSPAEPKPEISLFYPEENPVNKEIEVIFSASNLKNTSYDIKISIEKDGVLSQIYNQEKEGEDKWQSSLYYLSEVFSGTSFEGQFSLKIREDKEDFRGQADIIARIRETGKTSFSEFKGKINIVEPEEEEPDEKEEEESGPEPPQNLLLNEFFEEWEEPANSANYLYDWEYNGTVSHITRYEDESTGDYFVQWKPITTAHNLTQAGMNILKTGTYYAEIWIKPLNVDADNYLRVALDIADPADGSFPNANFTDYKNENGWVKLTKTRETEEGENGGIRIRAQRSSAVADPFLLIGAAWLGTVPPPQDWLDKN